MVHIAVPDWVVHKPDERTKRTTIYSVSVHPDGTRIATGGLDTKIRIWATAPILDEDAREPRHLCTLARHTGAVLAVRFSHSGRYLVSGSDDTVAVVWELDESAAPTSFGSSEPALEHWRMHRRLPGHTSDVTDISWSESDTYLATVGLDSLVIIWSGDTFDRVRTIRGHHGFVKGVAFDPTELFLATSSDDRTVKVWRTHDWGLEASISDPFRSSPSSTFFHRLSWTPDGKFLLTANAMNGPVFVSSIVERYTWASDLALVGHEHAVSVAACSPQWFQRADQPPVSVVALGAQDQTVSVWVTGIPRPLLVARDLFERHVMDMQWSADGYTLYACSSDGTVAALAFDASDLAPVAPDDVLATARRQLGAVPRARPAVRQAPPQRPLAAPVLHVHPPQRLVQTITRDQHGKRRICPTPVGASPAISTTMPDIPTEPPTLVSWPRPDPRTRLLDTHRTPLEPAHPLDVDLDDDPVTDDISVASSQTYTQDGIEGILEVRNDAHCAEIAWVVHDRVHWLDYAPCAVLCAAVSPCVVCVALCDHTLVWYTHHGRRTASMMLGVPTVKLAACGPYVAALGRDARVRRWHAQQRVSLGDVPLPRDAVAAMYVHTNGVPVAVLRRRQCVVALDTKTQAFVCIGHAALARLSTSWDVRLRQGAHAPVRHAECVLNDALATQTMEPERGVTPVRVLTATIRHLEMRMQAAELLESAAEYREALHALATILATEGLARHADDLLRSLLGPMYYRPDTTAWDPCVLGMPKRELLASVLATMQQHRRLDTLVHGVQHVLRTLASDAT